MFTAGQPLPEDPGESPEYDAEETREYELVTARDEFDPGPAEAEPATDEEDFRAVGEEAWEGDEFDEDPGEFDDREGFDETDGFDSPEALDGLGEWDEEEDENEGAVFEETGIEAAAEGETGKGDEPAKSPLDDLAVWFAGFRRRTATLASAGLKQLGEIKLPRHEIDGLKALAVGGTLAVMLLVGVGGYLLGKGSGDDLDTARLEGEFSGKQAGAIEGATRGYAAGFQKGRELTFRKSYTASYRRNYRRAYENAGMDPPRAKDIEVPNP